ncbi:putative phosphatase [Owenweeksia hongkongensis DSM 17368]|uniref:phosphoglycolate phosphatase n=1 Tax=Owenweeksia hongkongensis (strain DSM 17368 / CIP 108786 / JCM 12287 / NRRL B-23963 / UST20020801) TaxID=926562 RepID=G8R671_OWEHD|nr:HAD family hydrolase [Owenweeksia hongkongensis]AEV33291.1 putative phosphatase [Owenweeksia hongkongensis DSM 17368]
MSRLIVFDIDGTLTKTNAIDEKCFTRTVKQLATTRKFKFSFNEKWHFTDSYIAFQLAMAQNNDSFSEQEFKRQFLINLRLEAESTKFEAAEGAQSLLKELKKNEIPYALATGCWRKSAEIKLRAAGFPLPKVPMATSDKYFTRDEIVTQAIVASQRHYKKEFTDVVYVGDGYWDLVTCKKLNLRFVGVDPEKNLKKALLLKDYLALSKYPDLTSFLQLVETARVPEI